MEVYLVIAVIYAVYGISQGNRIYIAAFLGLFWPVFLFIGLFGSSIVLSIRKNDKSAGTAFRKFYGETDIDQCRDTINNSITSLCNALIEKSERDDENLLWSILLIDIGTYKASIRLFSGNTPVLAVSFLSIVNLLEYSSTRPDLALEDRKFLSALLADFTNKTMDIGQRITAIQGRKLFDYEVQEAKRLINSVKWNSDNKTFVLT